MLRVNQLEVLDIDQSSGQTRGNTFFTLFSPQNRDYDVSVVPLPLDQPHTESDAVDPTPGQVRQAAGTEMVLSWFGIPEPGFGGMGGNRALRFSEGGYPYEPLGRGRSV